jgi:hypothetical protein
MAAIRRGGHPTWRPPDKAATRSDVAATRHDANRDASRRGGRPGQLRTI